MTVVAFQESLRPVLPQVHGCKDYTEKEQLLRRIDAILVKSGLEARFVRESIEEREAKRGSQLTGKSKERHMSASRQALRCMVLKHLTNRSFRELSVTLAESVLCRSFCRVKDFEVVRVPSKTLLQQFSTWLPKERMNAVLNALTAAVTNEDLAEKIGMEDELDTALALVDSTCLKANIHYPTDWVLLKDATHTLVASIRTIRRHGLHRRIAAPEGFIRDMNALAMEMSAVARRTAGGKKERKRVLRRMKKLTKTVEAHARRYRDLLDLRWEKTDLSRKQAEVILRRMDKVLSELPEARRLAHERIIGERPVENSRKILSLYMDHVHVVVRGKAGAEIEYGNNLFIAESSEGYILDHELCREQSPGDAKLLQQRLTQIKEASSGKLCGVSADRGFDSKAVRLRLEQEEIFNGVCPRNATVLAKRNREDELLQATNRRRAQTEGRIGILKNVFLGGTPRAKSYEGRAIQVQWAVLTHNLWLIARRKWAAPETAAKLPEAA